MTKHGRGDDSAASPPCEWCGRPLPAPARTGRPRTYCRQSCRQFAYESRRRGEALALGPDDVVVSRDALDALRDDVYVLSCALDDAASDLADLKRPTVADLRAIIEDLVAASEGVRRSGMLPH